MPDISRRRAAAVFCAVAGSACLTFFTLPPSFAAAAGLPPAPHIVSAGETVQSVAAIGGFGLADFLRVNHLFASTRLSVGARLALPFLYKIQTGDQLGYLAHQYQTTVASLCALNHLSPSLPLRAGQVLLIARGSTMATGAGIPRRPLLRRFIPVAAPVKRMTATA